MSNKRSLLVRLFSMPWGHRVKQDKFQSISIPLVTNRSQINKMISETISNEKNGKMPKVVGEGASREIKDDLLKTQKRA